MSRQLAITVAMLMSQAGSRFRTAGDRTPHLIVIDQGTGKGLSLDLEGPRRVWSSMPDVPLNLLGDEPPEIADIDARRLLDIATVLRDICPEEMDEDGKWLKEWVLRHSNIRTVESDLAEDRT